MQKIYNFMIKKKNKKKKEEVTSCQIYIKDLDILRAMCMKGVAFRDVLREMIQNKVVRENQKKL